MILKTLHVRAYCTDAYYYYYYYSYCIVQVFEETPFTTCETASLYIIITLVYVGIYVRLLGRYLILLKCKQFIIITYEKHVFFSLEPLLKSRALVIDTAHDITHL